MAVYKVTRSSLKGVSNPCGRNWPLHVKVEALEEGADPNVFVFHTIPENSVNDEDPFSNVASVQDMNEIPVGEPKLLEDEMPTEDNVPFYRQDHVELDFHTPGEVERAWRIIQYDIRTLVTGRKQAETLKEEEEVYI